MRRWQLRLQVWIGLSLLCAGCATTPGNAPRPLVSSLTDKGNGQSGTGRLLIDIDSTWNSIRLPGSHPAQIWTMEGLAVDQMLVYAGVKDEQAIHAVVAGSKAKVFRFRAGMQPDEIVALFEGMLMRDGSRFTLTKLEPSPFGTGKGFRFEFELVRRVSHLAMRGVGYGAVSKGELFSMLYVAPRITFYARHIDAVEKISASARVQEE